MAKERSRVSRHQRCERGQGLVEFALVLPVLVLVLIAVLDFGRALYAYSVVANCAREGARFGIISPSDTAGIIATVHNAAIGLDVSQLAVTISEPEGTSIQVQVHYSFDLITPLMELVLGSRSLTLHSSSTMYTGY